MAHTTFTTTQRGLDRSSLPMRLYEKAKLYGGWNPSAIDYSRDRQDWIALAPEEQELLLRLTAMFQAGEEAVTLDLLPLIMVIAEEGRLEEEIFLTTFLADEAKHTDFFTRFMEEVVKPPGDLSAFHLDNYRAIFYEALPNTLQRLRQDRSPRAQVEAAVTYNLIVEGILAETGYHAYLTILRQRDILPGQQQGVIHLKRDESRHIAYGVFLISRLIQADSSLYAVAEEKMNELLTPALGVIAETFACYDSDNVPFSLTPEQFTSFALAQFQVRLERIEKAYRQAEGDQQPDDLFFEWAVSADDDADPTSLPFVAAG
jgi:ribonucleoside-diphosphate reductase beta chain